MLAVATTARAFAATLAGEVTLPRELRTPPLPEAHVPVGYCWQNNRCCQPPPSAAAQLHQRPRVAPELVIRLTSLTPRDTGDRRRVGQPISSWQSRASFPSGLAVAASVKPAACTFSVIG